MELPFDGAISEFSRTEAPAPFREAIADSDSDDKRRARLAASRHLLSHVDCAWKDERAVNAPDPLIVGGPEIRVRHG
jgi:hypothetical protein